MGPGFFVAYSGLSLNASIEGLWHRIQIEKHLPNNNFLGFSTASKGSSQPEGSLIGVKNQTFFLMLLIKQSPFLWEKLYKALINCRHLYGILCHRLRVVFAQNAPRVMGRLASIEEVVVTHDNSLVFSAYTGIDYLSDKEGVVAFRNLTH